MFRSFFLRFRVYFANFLGLRCILIILKFKEYFGHFNRFRGHFGHFKTLK